MEISILVGGHPYAALQAPVRLSGSSALSIFHFLFFIFSRLSAYIRYSPDPGQAGVNFGSTRPPGSGVGVPQPFRFFAARSRSSRSAVRFRPAASDAILARADRSSGVIFAAAFLPPSLPYFPKLLR